MLLFSIEGCEVYSSTEKESYLC